MRRLSIDLSRDPADAHPFHAAILDADDLSRAAVLAWDRGGLTPTSLARIEGPVAAVEAVLDASSLVRSYALSEAETATYAFVEQTERRADPALRSALTEPSVLAVPPVTYRSDGTVGVSVVGTHEALAAFAGALDADRHEVTELGEFREGTGVRGRHRAADPEENGPVRRVTERQREALRTAVEVGYYDVPRTGSMADIAAALGCAESTASELLRHAQSRVVRRAV